jgi:hypothetical protein
MSTMYWILGWAVVLGTLAFFAVREIRSGRKGPGDFDRTTHEAVRMASMDAQTHGPTNVSGMFGP